MAVSQTALLPQEISQFTQRLPSRRVKVSTRLKTSNTAVFMPYNSPKALQSTSKTIPRNNKRGRNCLSLVILVLLFLEFFSIIFRVLFSATIV